MVKITEAPVVCEGTFPLSGTLTIPEANERQYPQVDSDRVILLGHSEGCTLITATNARNPVNGLIMIAGAAEPLPEALKCQRKILYSEQFTRS